MIIIKLILYAVDILVCWLFISTITYGKRVSAYAAGRERIPDLVQHRRRARWLWATLITAVILLEAAIRTLHLHVTWDALLHWHISFAVSFIALVIALNSRYLNGIRNPRWHGLMGYLCLLCFLVTVVTAPFIIWRM